MNDPAHRIVHRYLHADAFINLDPITVVVADGGVVSAADLERLLGIHHIEAHDLVLYRLEGDPPTVFRWAGRGNGNTTVRGQLVLRFNLDHKHLVVCGEIALAARYAASQRESEEGTTTEPILPVKQRLMLINSIARRVVQDLRTNPQNISVVLSHLSDVVEICEQAGWAF